MYNQNAKNFYMALFEGSWEVNKHVFHFMNEFVLETYFAY